MTVSDGTDTDSEDVTVNINPCVPANHIWSATLNADRLDFPPYYGYSRVADDPNDHYGELDSTSITVGTTEYTIEEVSTSDFVGLILIFDQSPKALMDLGLFLCIDSEVHDLADFTVSGNKLSEFESGSWDHSKNFVVGDTYSLALATPGENNAPVIGGPASVTITVPENTPGSIGDAFSVTDADGDAITWSLDGSAAHFFNISNTGQLSASSATGLNYEVDGAILQFTVFASDEVATDSVAVTVRVTNVNDPPVIDRVGVGIAVAENTPGNIGRAYTATDEDGDAITWSVGGPTGDKFEISAAGQLSVKSPSGLDFEDEDLTVYPVNPDWPNPPAREYDPQKFFIFTVTAHDGKDPGNITVWLQVTNRTEAPAPPSAPTVSTVGKSSASLFVEWDAPTNTGPAITGYDVQYREKDATPAAAWASQDHTGTATTATITGLTATTTYEVQVQATNDEGTSGWSDSGEGTTVTTSAANQAPVIVGPASVTIVVAENKPNIGSAFTATDGDAVDVITWSVGAAAWDFFNISSAGQLSAAATGLDFEDVSILQLTVIASDGTDSDSVAVTVRVTDVDEPPGAPNAPALQSPGYSDTAMRVFWDVPANTGPAITGYEVEYRVSTMPKSPPSGPWSIYKPEGIDTITLAGLIPGTNYETIYEMMTTLTGLIQGTNYEIRVRAVNAEGAGDWSASSHAWTSGLTPK